MSWLRILRTSNQCAGVSVSTLKNVVRLMKATMTRSTAVAVYSHVNVAPTASSVGTVQPAATRSVRLSVSVSPVRTAVPLFVTATRYVTVAPGRGRRDDGRGRRDGVGLGTVGGAQNQSALATSEVVKKLHKAYLRFLLYRLVSGTVLAYTESIVCEYVLHGQFHKC